MKAIEAYLLYLSLKQHFTTKTYDYFRYNGKVKATADSYAKRTDKWVFEKLAKHPDPLNYLVANFVKNDKFWIGDFDECESNYRFRLRTLESLSYTMERCLRDFDCSIRGLIDAEKGTPKIIDHYLSGALPLELLVVFTDIVGCYSYWNKKLKNDVIWDYVGLLIRKYRPFIQYDKQKLKKIVKRACKPD